jgi:iron complex transport system substrate-binding protein
MRPLRILPFVMILAACQPGQQSDAGPGDAGNTYTRYARGFEVIEEPAYQLVQVFDPWQNSRNVTFTYLLAGNNVDLPDSLDRYPVIRTPVKRVVALSTTHVAMIDALGAAASIKGISGTRFVYNEQIRKRIDRREIIDVGYDQGLNLEVIVHLDPDVLFIYGVESGMQGMTDKLTELGVPVVYCGEYLEKDPLGKAEWIRFFALFYGLEQEAEHLFHQIDSSYHSLASLAGKSVGRPRVLTGLPWKGTWYMAGGESFAAKLIRDAGGDYLWNDNHSEEAVPLSLEAVYARALEADIWINPGEAASIDQLKNFDERFKELPVLRSGEVYNNDLRKGAGGGNDYWESGTIRPDLVLADLISVFHPDLLTDHPNIYYRKLK